MMPTASVAPVHPWRCPRPRCAVVIGEIEHGTLYVRDGVRTSVANDGRAVLDCPVCGTSKIWYPRDTRWREDW